MANSGKSPGFCPWCGRPRPNDAAPCPSCKGPSLRSVLAETGGRDPITFFGEDVPTLLYDEKSGDYYTNPDKQLAKWQYLTGQVNNVFPFAIGANQKVTGRVRVQPEVGLRGDTEVAMTMLTSSGRLAVQVFVPVLNKPLSNGLVPSSLMFGTAQLQANMPSTVFAKASYDWRVDFQDLSGSTNTVSPVFFGRRFLDSGKEKLEQVRSAAGMAQFAHPYWLVPTTAYNNTSSVAISPDPTISIPAGASVTVTYSVPSDADFDCWYILDDSSTSVGANTEISDLLATIQEGGSGPQLVDVPPGSNGLSWRNFLASPTVPVTGFPSGGTNTATGGIRAASLPSPAAGWSHLFKRGTDIIVTFKSTDAGTITLRTAFLGILVYSKPAEECAA